ncbi:MAG: hypothetical protein P8Y54_06575 [Xanthomonadales bacterium]
MNHHSLTLLMPAEPPLEQATEISPPAPQQPAVRGGARVLASLRFVAGVVANAAGFGMLLAGCWFSLQLMQLLVMPGV